MDINELLRSLNSLFSKVVLLDLRKRTTSYKQQGSRDIQQDIVTPLSECIDKLAACKSAQAQASIVMQATNIEQPAAKINQDPAQLTSPQTATVGVLSTDFSEHLESHPIHSESGNYLGDKLQASTWSHFHTAILKANEGDAKTAKLHADIANQAMKEAGHYMSDDDFKNFSEEIEKVLNEVKQQSS